WPNLNTGALEQYLNEKGKVEGFKKDPWRWRLIAFGIIVSVFFTAVSQYMSLKVGFSIGGGGLIFYFTAMALKWHPNDISIVGGASAGVSAYGWGFVFIFPAIFLLMMHPDYEIMDANGNTVNLISEAMIPSLAMIFICAFLGAFLGVMFLTVFRRLWILEDPLPFPGFEVGLKQREINYNLSKGSISQALKLLKTMFYWGIVGSIFAFLRDVRIINNRSVLDSIFGGDYYSNGMLKHPHTTYTFFGWYLMPLQFSIGWFMRFRLAFLVASGSIFTWFVIVPLAVGFNTPIWIPKAGEYYALQSFPIVTAEWEVNQAPAFVAATRVAQPIAIGVILGSGFTAILKMKNVIKSLVTDLVALAKSPGKSREYIDGRGWYEWPNSHMVFMMIITIVGMTMAFTIIGGYPVIGSIVVGILFVIFALLLGVIGIKILGEVNQTPSSGLSFIMLIVLIAALRALGTDVPTTIVMALIGAMTFAIFLNQAGNIIYSYKGSLYWGLRPYYVVKSRTISLPLGALIGIFVAYILSTGLATVDPATGEPVLDLAAPQARAFATFIQLIFTKVPWDWILIGVCIGIFIELMTGMGTAFGLGMYLPFTLTINLIFGGIAREWWQRRRFDVEAKRQGWTDEQKSHKLQHTFMIFAGIGLGEGILGMILSFYLVIPFLIGGG
ncbi:MAG: OPT/YSL family transporter, partial [Thermoplasmata archaeon]